jgi:hypothetical protein
MRKISALQVLLATLGIAISGSALVFAAGEGISYIYGNGYTNPGTTLAGYLATTATDKNISIGHAAPPTSRQFLRACTAAGTATATCAIWDPGTDLARYAGSGTAAPNVSPCVPGPLLSFYEQTAHATDAGVEFGLWYKSGPGDCEWTELAVGSGGSQSLALVCDDGSIFVGSSGGNTTISVNWSQLCGLFSSPDGSVMLGCPGVGNTFQVSFGPGANQAMRGNALSGAAPGLWLTGISGTATVSRTVTGTTTVAQSGTGTTTASTTGTVVGSATGTASASQTVSQTGTYTVSGSATATGTASSSVTGTGSVTGTATGTLTSSNTASATATASYSRTVTQTGITTVSQSVTSTATGTTTGSVSSTVSGTVSQTATETVTVTATETASYSQTATSSASQTDTDTISQTKTATATSSHSQTDSVSNTTTNSKTVTNHNTQSVTGTPTTTRTVTTTHTNSASQTSTVSASYSQTDTKSASGTISTTNTQSITGTLTDTISVTNTQTATQTITYTSGGVQVFVTGQSDTEYIALNSTVVYWTKDDGSIGYKFKDGSSQGSFVTGLGGAPRGIAADDSSVYWANVSLGTISQQLVSGGSVNTFASAQRSPVAVVLSTSNVYWTQDDIPCVSVQAKSGGSITNYAITGGLDDEGWGLALTGTDLYWSAYNNDGPGNLSTMPITGGTNSIWVGSLTYPGPMASDTTYVYWFDMPSSSREIVKQPIAGGATVPVVTTGSPHGFAVDATNIYWADYSDNTIKVMPLAGATGTYTVTATGTSTVSSTASVTGSVTATASASATATQTQTATSSASQTVTQSGTQTITGSVTVTKTGTVTNSVSGTATVTVSTSSTATQTQTATSSVSAPATVSVSVTGTKTMTVTAAMSVSGTATNTQTASAAGTANGISWQPLPKASTADAGVISIGTGTDQACSGATCASLQPSLPACKDGQIWQGGSGTVTTTSTATVSMTCRNPTWQPAGNYLPTPSGTNGQVLMESSTGTATATNWVAVTPTWLPAPAGAPGQFLGWTGSGTATNTSPVAMNLPASVGGSGSPSYLPKWSGTATGTQTVTALGNSLISDDGTQSYIHGNLAAGASLRGYAGTAAFGALDLPMGEILWSTSDVGGRITFANNLYLGANGASWYYLSSGAGAFLQIANGALLFSTAPSGYSLGHVATMTGQVTVGDTGGLTLSNGTLTISAGNIQVGDGSSAVRLISMTNTAVGEPGDVGVRSNGDRILEYGDGSHDVSDGIGTSYGHWWKAPAFAWYCASTNACLTVTPTDITSPVIVATPAANKMPRADSNGTLNAWITNASTSAAGICQLGTGSNQCMAGNTSLLGLSNATPSAESYGAAGSAGTGTSASRSDHIHALPALPAASTSVAGISKLDPNTPGDDGTASAGSRGMVSDSGHTHRAPGRLLVSYVYGYTSGSRTYYPSDPSNTLHGMMRGGGGGGGGASSPTSHYAAGAAGGGQGGYGEFWCTGAGTSFYLQFNVDDRASGGAAGVTGNTGGNVTASCVIVGGATAAYEVFGGVGGAGMTGDLNIFVLGIVPGGVGGSFSGPFTLGWKGASGFNGQNYISNSYSSAQSCVGGVGGGEGGGVAPIGGSGAGGDADLTGGGGGGGACALPGAGGFGGGWGSRGWIKIEEHSNALSTN